MHKVIVERPRWSPGPPKQHRRANLPVELMPKFESTKRPYKLRKGQKDLLGPLRRWLRSKVGRPWNEVYSEACAVIKSGNYVREHVKTHLLQYVELHTFIHNGKVCSIETYSSFGITPIGEQRFGPDFYVDPITGLLMETERPSRSARRIARRLARLDCMRWLSDRVALKQINGIWYSCLFRPVIPQGAFRVFDHLARQVVGLGGLIRRNGVFLHCFEKRQLSRRELKRFDLKNYVPNAVAERRAVRCLQPSHCTSRLSRTVLSCFEPGQQPSRNRRGWFCAWAGSKDRLKARGL
ncbi:MAG: hypothetical protein AB1705_21720 [Verrucomicrobiota bacterium]